MESNIADIERDILHDMGIKIIQKIENFGNSFDYYFAQSIASDEKYIVKSVPLDSLNFQQKFDSNSEYLEIESGEIKKIRSEFLWKILESRLGNKNVLFKLEYYDGTCVKETINHITDILEKEDHIRLFFSQLINGLYQFHKRSIYHGRLVLSNLYYSHYKLKFLDYRFIDINPTINLISDPMIINPNKNITDDLKTGPHNDDTTSDGPSSTNYVQIKKLMEDKIKLDIYCLSFILKKLMFPDQFTNINEYIVYYNLTLPPNDFSDDLISFYNNIVDLLNSDRPDLFSLMKTDFMKKTPIDWYRSPLSMTMSQNVRSTLIPKLIERFGTTTAINDTIKSTSTPTNKRLKSTDDVSKLNELLNYPEIGIINNYQYIKTQLRNIAESQSTSFICSDATQINPTTDSLWKAVFECLFIYKDKINFLCFKNTKLGTDIQYLNNIFAHLDHVTDLKLSGNILTDQECSKLGKYLCKMINLSTFDINSNKISGNGLKSLSISTFVNLTSLNVSNNIIDSQSVQVVCEQLSTLTRLSDLDISCNKIAEAMVTFTESFKYLTTLETLIISTNGITSISLLDCLTNFKFLERLKFLNIDGNQINDTTMASIYQNIGHEFTMVPPISKTCIII